jgi:hypothetical protein
LGEILEGNAAIFAGAGLSAPAGFVDWRELIRPLAAELKLNIDLEDDLVAVAQFHVNANGSNRHRLHKAVIEALSPTTPPTKNHELLASLPIPTWWTTNYDKLIENALRAAGKVVDVKDALPQLADTRPGRHATLFKMHGDVDRPNEAVATRDDFERYPKDREAFITALAGDLVKRTFLFLGFSFTDPNLAHVLAHIRLNFTTNQRRHYAVFRKRTKLPKESQEEFDHHSLRQALVIEDLKRYNVRVLLIDDYTEITEFLDELVARYRRRTVFVSASAADFSPWGQPAVSSFAQALGRALIASGTRVASGLGAGIGDALVAGALRELMSTKSSIEDGLVLRPFPQVGAPDERAVLWEDYRQEIISNVGIAVFLFGNKIDEHGDLTIADGMLREFEIARQQGVAVIPVGATGAAAKELARRVLADPNALLPELGPGGPDAIRELFADTSDLETLLVPLMALIRRLREGTGT